jgi:choline dehydrogenase-like flavoprotein
MSTRRRFLRDTALLFGTLTLSRSKVSAQNHSNVFDYVIIGAGSSGCVIANRLTADASKRVLLIEAGGPDVNPLIAAPGKWTSLLGTPVDWNYATEPDPGLGGRSLRWPRGRTYGGSSAMNAMAYVRGHQLCFDMWAAEAGVSWNYRGVLPYFLRVEDNSRGASDYHGAGGLLAVSDTHDPHAGHVAFLEAARELGFGARPDWDFNGPQQEQGAGYYQKNIRNGRRHSAAAAFLTPVLTRPNLTIWPDSRLLRVTMDGRRVTGVEVGRAKAIERVTVSREVIVAAGVIESPKILMLSGIGPADALRSHGITVVADLPGVGANLHDHPKVSLRWSARQPLAASTVSAGLFTYSQRGATPRPPDLQFYVGRGLDTVDPFVTLTVALSQPRSRGLVRLRSADPLAPPEILPGYFSAEADLDALVEGARLALAMGDTRAFAPVRGAPADPDGPVRTPADLRAFVRRTADTIFHPVGTCRMGTGSDAVVDAQLRVHGIEGLRVADGSVMPVTVNSQTHAACVMIGERLAANI